MATGRSQQPIERLLHEAGVLLLIAGAMVDWRARQNYVRKWQKLITVDGGAGTVRLDE